MSYIILRGRWCHVIVLNVLAPTGDKIDDVKDSLYEEVERVFDKFPKYRAKISLGDFNVKEDMEDIFNPKIGNKSLHEISYDNGLRRVKFPRLEKLTFRSIIVPDHNIYIYKNVSVRLFMTSNLRK
jgi:exonuclease III